jgi:hypothetical protein
MGDFNRFMQDMLSWQYAMGSKPLAVEGEIAVQLQHRAVLFYGFGTIYLDFIVILGPACQKKKQGKDKERSMFVHNLNRSFHRKRT